MDLKVDGWRINRRIGMSGSMLSTAISKEIKHDFSPKELEQLEQHHAEYFSKFTSFTKPLKGAFELLNTLRKSNIPFAIATSGSRPGIDSLLEMIGAKDDLVIEGKKVSHPKPEPDEFRWSREQLGVCCEECFVVGDAPWDLLAAERAQMFGIGLLSGGHHSQDLYQAGAHRVFADPQELMESLYQLGISHI